MNIWKNYKHIIVALVILLVIKLFLPTGNGLTKVGVNVLAVMIPVVYLWIAIGTQWVSFMALAAIIITGAMTPTAVYQLSLGHSVVPIVIASMALTACLTALGITQKIATWFITRKFIRKRPYVFIAMFLLSLWVLGLFMETVSLSVLYIAFAKAICDDLGYEKGEPFYTVLMMGILWIGAIATIATPIAHILPIVMIGTAKSAIGLNISFGQWMSVGVPYAIMVYILAMLVIRFIWKPDVSKFSNYDIELVKSRTQPLSTEAKIACAVFLAVVLAWVSPEFLKPFAPGLAAVLSAWGTTVPPIVGITLLCIIRVKGKPIASFSDMMKGVPISVLIFVASVVVLGTVMSSNETGITTFMRNILMPITQSLPPVAIVAFALIGCLIVTNLISDTVTWLVFFNVSVPLLANSGISIIAFVVSLGLMAGLGCATPAACAISPIIFGSEHATIKNTLKYNIILFSIIAVLTLALLWPLASRLLP